MSVTSTLIELHPSFIYPNHQSAMHNLKMKRWFSEKYVISSGFVMPCHILQTPVNKDGSVKVKKQRIQYVAPPPKVKKKIEEPIIVQEALYKVTVYTADVPSASTDANVSL